MLSLSRIRRKNAQEFVTSISKFNQNDFIEGIKKLINIQEQMIREFMPEAYWGLVVESEVEQQLWRHFIETTFRDARISFAALDIDSRAKILAKLMIIFGETYATCQKEEEKKEKEKIISNGKLEENIKQVVVENLKPWIQEFRNDYLINNNMIENGSPVYQINQRRLFKTFGITQGSEDSYPEFFPPTDRAKENATEFIKENTESLDGCLRYQQQMQDQISTLEREGKKPLIAMYWMMCSKSKIEQKIWEQFVTIIFKGDPDTLYAIPQESRINILNRLMFLFGFICSQLSVEQSKKREPSTTTIENAILEELQPIMDFISKLCISVVPSAASANNTINEQGFIVLLDALALTYNLYYFNKKLHIDKFSGSTFYVIKSPWEIEGFSLAEYALTLWNNNKRIGNFRGQHEWVKEVCRTLESAWFKTETSSNDNTVWLIELSASFLLRSVAGTKVATAEEDKRAELKELAQELPNLMPEAKRILCHWLRNYDPSMSKSMSILEWLRNKVAISKEKTFPQCLLIIQQKIQSLKEIESISDHLIEQRGIISPVEACIIWHKAMRELEQSEQAPSAAAPHPRRQASLAATNQQVEAAIEAVMRSQLSAASERERSNEGAGPRSYLIFVQLRRVLTLAFFEKSNDLFAKIKEVNNNNKNSYVFSYEDPKPYLKILEQMLPDELINSAWEYSGVQLFQMKEGDLFQKVIALVQGFPAQTTGDAIIIDLATSRSEVSEQHQLRLGGSRDPYFYRVTTFMWFLFNIINQYKDSSEDIQKLKKFIGVAINKKRLLAMLKERGVRVSEFLIQVLHMVLFVAELKNEPFMRSRAGIKDLFWELSTLKENRQGSENERYERAANVRAAVISHKRVLETLYQVCDALSEGGLGIHSLTFYTSVINLLTGYEGQTVSNVIDPLLLLDQRNQKIKIKNDPTTIPMMLAPPYTFVRALAEEFYLSNEIAQKPKLIDVATRLLGRLDSHFDFMKPDNVEKAKLLRAYLSYLLYSSMLFRAMPGKDEKGLCSILIIFIEAIDQYIAHHTNTLSQRNLMRRVSALVAVAAIMAEIAMVCSETVRLAQNPNENTNSSQIRDWVLISLSGFLGVLIPSVYAVRNWTYKILQEELARLCHQKPVNKKWMLAANIILGALSGALAGALGSGVQYLKEGKAQSQAQEDAKIWQSSISLLLFMFVGGMFVSTLAISLKFFRANGWLCSRDAREQVGLERDSRGEGKIVAAEQRNVAINVSEAGRSQLNESLLGAVNNVASPEEWGVTRASRAEALTEAEVSAPPMRFKQQGGESVISGWRGLLAMSPTAVEAELNTPFL